MLIKQLNIKFHSTNLKSIETVQESVSFKAFRHRNKNNLQSPQLKNLCVSDDIEYELNDAKYHLKHNTFTRPDRDIF